MARKIFTLIRLTIDLLNAARPYFNRLFRKKALAPLAAQPAPSPMTDLSRWQPPESARPYIALISTVERRHGIPHNLLARLLHQESRYRPDIIDGRVKSRVGAAGIAQVMPLTASSPGYGAPRLSDPLDPFEAIPWAGSYLSGLYKSSGDWRKALAAYNYGMGNVNRAIKSAGENWLRQMPTETKNYVIEIAQDVPRLTKKNV